MTPFTYRPLSTDDAAAWQALRLEGTRDFPLGFFLSYADVAASSLDDCRNRLRDGTLRGVFAADGLIGFCGYHRQKFARVQHRAEVGPFFVTRSQQGSGAAKTLMAGLIAEARRDGLAQLELYVDTENPRAIAFYEGQGFTRVATHYDSVRIDGESRDDFFYTLRL